MPGKPGSSISVPHTQGDSTQLGSPGCPEYIFSSYHIASHRIDHSVTDNLSLPLLVGTPPSLTDGRIYDVPYVRYGKQSIAWCSTGGRTAADACRCSSSIGLPRHKFCAFFIGFRSKIHGQGFLPHLQRQAARHWLSTSTWHVHRGGLSNFVKRRHSGPSQRCHSDVAHRRSHVPDTGETARQVGCLGRADMLTGGPWHDGMGCDYMDASAKASCRAVWCCIVPC